MAERTWRPLPLVVVPLVALPWRPDDLDRTDQEPLHDR